MAVNNRKRKCLVKVLGKRGTTASTAASQTDVKVFFFLLRVLHLYEYGPSKGRDKQNWFEGTSIFAELEIDLLGH